MRPDQNGPCFCILTVWLPQTIYPTIVTLLVERTSSYYSRTLGLESMRTPWHLPPSPKRDSRSLLDTEDFSVGLGGTSLEDGAQSDAVGGPAEPAQTAVSLVSRIRYVTMPHTDTVQSHGLRSAFYTSSSAA